MSDLTESISSCLARIRQILLQARHAALQTANAVMVSAYWEIGREIVEEEQRGQERAEYGARLVQEISTKLTAEFGRGFSERNIWYIRQFYLTYADRIPIPHSLSAELGEDKKRAGKIPHSLSAELTTTSRTGSENPLAGQELSPTLTFTHYRMLMRVSDPRARSFYEVECAKANWAVRDLERQISSLLFERLSRSRDKEVVLALARDGHEVHDPADLVKDPYYLEFLGLPEAAKWQENDLEQALIDRMQQFLLELGRDLFFVARQKRITIERDHFYIDLVFYHRALRCFLLIDLKLSRVNEMMAVPTSTAWRRPPAVSPGCCTDPRPRNSSVPSCRPSHRSGSSFTLVQLGLGSGEGQSTASIRLANRCISHHRSEVAIQSSR